jgi:hypothetical protein
MIGPPQRVVVERRSEDEHIGDLVAADGLLWCVRGIASGDELVELLVADRHGINGLANIQSVAGGHEESVTQPYWGLDGRLWFVSDRTG